MMIKRMETNKKNTYSLKNKKRFMSIISLVTILFLLFLNPLISSGFREQKTITVSVSEGDTLWTIAQSYDPDGDIRKIVYDIKVLNGLKSYDIIAGTTLKIPV